MPKLIRTKERREQDAVTIAEMYVRGSSFREIADAHGLTHSQAYDDVCLIRENWKKSAVSDYDTRVAIELHKLDKVEMAAWTGWEKSLQDAVEEDITYTKKQQIRKKGQPAKASKELTVKEKQVKTKGQSGNPAYLSTITRCIERRCQILGLDQPKKIAPVALDENGKWSPKTDQEKLEILKKVFDRGSVTILPPASIKAIEHAEEIKNHETVLDRLNKEKLGST